MNKPSIVILAEDPSSLTTAQTLALELQLPIITKATHEYDYFLLITSSYIGLKKNNSPARPLYIDFAKGKTGYRLKQSSLRKEALVRALGLKAHSTKKIIDATGGLARDTYLLAGFGFQVTMLERSPIIYTIIADAIVRGLQNPLTHNTVARITLIKTDATTYLEQFSNDDKPALIYLDPMFEERSNTALPKQDMLIFHDIVGDDTDSALLLQKALSCAKERVVVKRPRKALPLPNAIEPSFSLTGSSSRFDIYLL